MRCSGLLLLYFLTSFGVYNAAAFDPCNSGNSDLADGVWVSKPGSLDLACARRSFSMSCCVLDNYTISWWYRRNVTDDQDWRPVPTKDDNYLLLGKTLTVKTLDLADDGIQYRCDVGGTNESFIKTVEVDECNSCSEGAITEPPGNVTLPAPIGGNVTFRCVVFIDCTETDQPLITYINWYRRHNKSDMTVVPVSRLSGHIVDTKVILSSIDSSVTILLVNESDYQYEYLCSSKKEVRIFKLIVQDPPAPLMSMVLLPIFLPLGVALALIIVYVTRYDLRLLLHSCTSEDSPEASKVFLINSEIQKDARFIQMTLIPVLEKCLDFKLIVNFRDFDVSNYEQQYYDQLRTCSRVLILLSPSFLADDICNKAFQLAYTLLKERHKMIFVVLSDLDGHWTPAHGLLRQCVSTAGRFYSSTKRLAWKPEYFTDVVDDTTSQRALFWRVKRWKINRESAMFWKKLQLALPNNKRRIGGGRRVPSSWEMTSCIISPPVGAFSRLESVSSDIAPHV